MLDYPYAVLKKSDHSTVKCPRANNTCRGVFGTLVLEPYYCADLDEERAGAYVELLNDMPAEGRWRNAAGGWTKQRDRHGDFVALSNHAQRQHDAGHTPRSRRDFTESEWGRKGHETITIFEIYEPTRVRCARCRKDAIVDPSDLAHHAPSLRHDT